MSQSGCAVRKLELAGFAVVATAAGHRLVRVELDTVAKVATVFENERYYPLVKWSKTLLPTDRPQWSSRDGKTKLGAPFVSGVGGDKPPRGCGWTGEWSRESWLFAVDFPASFGSEEHGLHCVRRRCWRRAFTRLKGVDPCGTASRSHSLGMSPCASNTLFLFLWVRDEREAQPCNPLYRILPAAR